MSLSRQVHSEPPELPGGRNAVVPERPVPWDLNASTAATSATFEALLSEIAQQTLLTTRATGAAIALTQGSEMVCRATTGGHAPDLGVRLDTQTGLSGACVQSGRVQICSDTELEPRVDVDACRSLGVRSILIAPLHYESRLVGVMELFSPVVRAFGERDVQTLEACTRRILDGLQKATGDAADTDPQPPPLAPVSDPLPSWQLASLATVPENRRRDFTTTILTGLVIGLAIVLGTLLGMRFTRQRNGKVSIHAGSLSQTSGNILRDASARQVSDAANATPQSTSGAIAESPKDHDYKSDRAGGLIVYQGNRVVFQIPPETSNPLARTGAREAQSYQDDSVELSPNDAGKLLFSRVEPQYPAKALAAHIQGPVDLRLTVDRAGAVQVAAVLRGPPELAKSAVDAVKQWRFQPYSPNGTPRSFRTTATIDFKLP